MSKLRDQLQHAREQHLLARYPGDLVRDIDRGDIRTAHSRMRIWPIAGLAAAALVALAVWINLPSHSSRPISVATSQPDQQADERLWYAVDSVPSWPGDVSIVPSPSAIVPDSTSWSMPGSPGIPNLESVTLSENSSSSEQTQTEDAS